MVGLYSFIQSYDFLNRIQVLFSILGACSSKGRIVILGRIVSASGQIFRSDFRPQDEIFRPGMPFRPLDEQALRVINIKANIAAVGNCNLDS